MDNFKDLQVEDEIKIKLRKKGSKWVTHEIVHKTQFKDCIGIIVQEVSGTKLIGPFKRFIDKKTPELEDFTQNTITDYSFKKVD